VLLFLKIKIKKEICVTKVITVVHQCVRTVVLTLTKALNKCGFVKTGKLHVNFDKYFNISDSVSGFQFCLKPPCYIEYFTKKVNLRCIKID